MNPVLRKKVAGYKLPSPTHRSILLALCDYADADGSNCHPGHSRIAWDTDYTEKHVKRIIHSFLDSGVLTLTQKGQGKGYFAVYKINLSALPKREPFTHSQKGTSTPPKEELKGDIYAQEKPKQKGTSESIIEELKGDIEGQLDEQKGTSTPVKGDIYAQEKPNTLLLAYQKDYQEEKKKNIVEFPLDQSQQLSQRTEVEEVFDYWKQKLNHPRAIFSADRKRKIAARLREGFSVEQLLQAVDGCAASGFHMGENSDGKLYDGIGLIFRNAENTEKFIGITERGITANSAHGESRSSSTKLPHINSDEELRAYLQAQARH